MCIHVTLWGFICIGFMRLSAAKFHLYEVGSVRKKEIQNRIENQLNLNPRVRLSLVLAEFYEPKTILLFFSLLL